MQTTRQKILKRHRLLSALLCAQFNKDERMVRIIKYLIERSRRIPL
jgi:hypothetical protein